MLQVLVAPLLGNLQPALPLQPLQHLVTVEVNLRLYVFIRIGDRGIKLSGVSAGQSIVEA
jgi:hypothetical protein